jgi:hypothetical protein
MNMHAPIDDMWNPNTWELDRHEHRIYADETLELYAVVDAKWYPILCQWKWSIHTIKVHRGAIKTPRKQFYLRRTETTFHAPDGESYISPIHGYEVRHRHRTARTVFLHQQVMRLAGIEPPSPEHIHIDHEDRDTMNCREGNLKWTTVQENRDNNDHKPIPPHRLPKSSSNVRTRGRYGHGRGNAGI